ncbi:unnamed protein product [Moneuplotes crassus]|uniref:Uncharacterized protein n=1 Tax=Euplotes crassus TaxID=5936 RepID=A0AAD1UCE1_EUPCR|nr:unnamed protein product [Moneuplotes crassus]
MDSIRMSEKQTYKKEMDMINAIHWKIGEMGYSLSISCLKIMQVRGLRKNKRFLRRHSFVQNYLVVGYGMHCSVKVLSFDWNHPTDIKNIIRTLNPRVILKYLNINNRLAYAGFQKNNFKKFSMDLLGFSAYTLRECQIERLNLSTKQFKKIIQCCRLIKCLGFQRCTINFEGITLNSTFEYKTQTIWFDDTKEQTTDEDENGFDIGRLSEKSFKSFIMSISECNLRNSLKRLSFGQCLLEQDQVLTSLQDLNLYALKISFFSINENKFRSLSLEPKTQNPGETLPPPKQRKCIIQ